MSQLHSGQFHGPTPNRLPGGTVITTGALQQLLQSNPGTLVFDVLNGQYRLMNAMNAVPASAPGDFNDQTQQQFGQFLQQVTQGNRSVPMVYYCLNNQCWMSYNAALRAVNMGFTQVYWYRGGVESWAQAGLPTQRGW